MLPHVPLIILSFPLFPGIFLHSLKCLFQVFEIGLAGMSAETPHFLGSHSVPASNPSLSCVKSSQASKPSPEPAALIHPTASCPSQSHNLQREGGIESIVSPQVPLFYTKNVKVVKHSQGLFLPRLDYLSGVNQQKWAVTGDLNKQAKPFSSRIKRDYEK